MAWIHRHGGFDREGRLIIDLTLVPAPDDPNYKQVAWLPNEHSAQRRAPPQGGLPPCSLPHAVEPIPEKATRPQPPASRPDEKSANAPGVLRPPRAPDAPCRGSHCLNRSKGLSQFDRAAGDVYNTRRPWGRKGFDRAFGGRSGAPRLPGGLVKHLAKLKMPT